MLETSVRLLRLMGLLQSRRDWSGADLAERLGVTTRTVRNDVERLRILGYRNMAGLASFQADFLAANLKVLIGGEGELGHYQINPPMIAVPLGPEGGAGQLPGIDGVASPELISNVKGRAMLVERHTEHFDAPAKAA